MTFQYIIHHLGILKPLQPYIKTNKYKPVY